LLKDHDNTCEIDEVNVTSDLYC